MKTRTEMSRSDFCPICGEKIELNTGVSAETGMIWQHMCPNKCCCLEVHKEDGKITSFWRIFHDNSWETKEIIEIKEERCTITEQ
jgi:hypothetical protein